MSTVTTLPILTAEQIRERAPQVYTEAPFDKTSTRYTFIPTYQVIEDMKALGWEVCEATTMATSDPIQKKYGKHMIKFFNPSLLITGEDGAPEAHPQIVVINNHRGWGRFRFELGVFRFVCSNGLIIKSTDLGSFIMRHRGYSFQELKELVEKAVVALPQVVEKINVMSERIMTPKEQREFAEKALRLRIGEERQVSPEEVHQLLLSTRKEDEGSSAWKIFNRVQERVIRGGFEIGAVDGKVRKVRKITNMLKDVELNQELWSLIEEYA